MTIHDRHSAKIIKIEKWWRLRRSVLARDGHQCRKCGSMRHLQVDHIEPVRDAPERAFDPSNLQTLCRSCHAAKTRIEIGLGRPDPKREAWQALLRQETPTVEAEGDRECSTA
ncbi:MAG: HNH endonuclease signature motif containing protein [Paracoccaceae bacterium]|nr:HNH endonuclease signature motif containing protein [Paracoccaceae bacterium]